MAHDRKPAPMLAAEKAFKQSLRDHQSDTRERETAEAEVAQEAKIARLREARLARAAAEGKK